MMRIRFAFFLLPILVLLFSMCKPETAEKAKVSAPAEVPPVSPDAMQYEIDPERSVVKWAAYKPTYGHNGTLKMKEGVLNVRLGVVESGTIIMDMNSIEVEDLRGQQKNQLETHLKGMAENKEGDFFDVPKYPEAKFELIKTLRVVGRDDYNFQVFGNLTVKDSIKQVAFKSNIEITNDYVIAKSLPFAIDRNNWDIKMSGSTALDEVTDDLIQESINLQIDIVADRIVKNK
jgi:polyisoprenoid-binding protein YceI